MRDDVKLFAWATGLLFIGCATALCQQMQQHGATAMHNMRQPFDIETFGIFRDMMLNGDFTPKVTLDAAMAKHPTTGIGAVAGARGEITIYDGKFIVSYGKPGATPDAGAEQAAFVGDRVRRAMAERPNRSRHRA